MESKEEKEKLAQEILDKLNDPYVKKTLKPFQLKKEVLVISINELDKLEKLSSRYKSNLIRELMVGLNINECIISVISSEDIKHSFVVFEERKKDNLDTIKTKSTIIQKIVDIHHGSNVDESNFLNGSENLVNYLLSINELELKKTLIESILRHYRVEIEKGETRLNKRCLDLNTILLHSNENLKNIKKAKPLLVEGKKLNISERFKMLDSILNITHTLGTKNISDSERHTFIAQILGCEHSVARNLYNGTHQKRTPPRNDLMDRYLNKFK